MSVKLSIPGSVSANKAKTKGGGVGRTTSGHHSNFPVPGRSLFSQFIKIHSNLFEKYANKLVQLATTSLFV